MIGAFRNVIMGEMSIDEAMKWACQHALEQIEKDPLKSFEEPIQYELTRGNCIPYLVWEIRGATNWRIEWLAYHWKEMWKPMPPILELDWVTLVAKKHWSRKLPIMPVALIIPQRDNTTLIKLYDLFNESDLKAFWNYLSKESQEKPLILVKESTPGGDFIDWLAKVNGVNFTVVVATTFLPRDESAKRCPKCFETINASRKLALKYMPLYMFNKHVIDLYTRHYDAVDLSFVGILTSDVILTSIIYKGRVLGIAHRYLWHTVFRSVDGKEYSWHVFNMSMYVFKSILTWREEAGDIIYGLKTSSYRDIAKYDSVFKKYMVELRNPSRGAFEIYDDSGLKALVLRLYDY